MEINVDKEEKNIENKKVIEKEIKKSEKKENTKLFNMVKKIPTIHNPIVNDNQIVNNSRSNYVATEWGDIAQNSIYKILSLPAGEDAAEFEHRLRNSNDMNNLINENNFVFDWLLNKIDKRALYGLSYGAILADVKVKNKNKRVKSIAPTSNNEPKEGLINNISTPSNPLDL